MAASLKLSDQIMKGLRGTRIMPILARNYAVYQMWRTNISKSENARMVGMHEFISDGWLYKMVYVKGPLDLAGYSGENVVVVQLNGAMYNSAYAESFRALKNQGLQTVHVDADGCWVSPFDRLNLNVYF